MILLPLKMIGSVSMGQRLEVEPYVRNKTTKAQNSDNLIAIVAAIVDQCATNSSGHIIDELIPRALLLRAIQEQSD
jgi:hypothetical protein